MRARPLLDLVRMTKPNIALMVGMATLVGYLQGAAGDGARWPLLGVLLGVVLAAAASSVLNQVLEKALDAQMERTRDRPLPTGRITRVRATVFGLALAVAGTGLLAWCGNGLAALLNGLTLAAYLLVYTPLKQRTSLNTLVGAVPGAMPPVLGYVAARGELGLPCLVLFAVVFLWQLPHFLSIAWLYRMDYERAGFQMVSRGDTGGRHTARRMLVYCVLLCLVSVLPYHFGVGGWLYLAGTQVLGVLFLAFAVAFWMNRTRAMARRVLWMSLVYLPGVFGLAALGV